MKLIVLADRPINHSQNLNFNLFLEQVDLDFETLAILKRGTNSKISINTLIKKKIFFENFNHPKSLIIFENTIKSYKPDVIYILNFKVMHKYIDIAKNTKKDIRVVLDVKTPCLFDDDDKQKLLKNNNNIIEKIDTILTLSKKSCETWFSKKDINSKIVVYPLTVKKTALTDKDNKIKIKKKEKKYTRLIYIGNLSIKRELKNIIENLSLLKKSNFKFFFHFYGQGTDLKNLRDITKKYKLEKNILFHGMKTHNYIQKNLYKFDIGINWITSKTYNDSPSLKFLEYMQSKIKVISSENFFNNRYKESGFDFITCKDNGSDLYNQIMKINNHDLDLEKNRIIVNNKFCFEVTYKKVIFQILKKNNLSVNAYVESYTSRKKKNIKMPKYKVFIFSEFLSSITGGAEKICIELANKLSKDSDFQIFLGYKPLNGKLISKKLNNDIIQIPINSSNDLDYFLSNNFINLFFLFYFNHKLLKYFEIAKKNNILFGAQECSNPIRVINNIQKNISTFKNASKIRDTILSQCAILRLTMKSYRSYVPDEIKPNTISFPNPCYYTKYKVDIFHNRQTKYIIHVNGFKSSNKNLIFLLKAFNDLKDIFPNWKLKIISIGIRKKNSSFQIELHEYINENFLNDRILFIDPKENILEEFALSDIQAVTSFEEGCPNVVLEALSVGLPSIGFNDCPGTNELITNEWGVLCDRDHDIFVNRLRELMHNKDLRQCKSREAILLSNSNQFRASRSFKFWKVGIKEACNINK
jgi:glycosyltransferase involved in cell wall biosynthesis